MNRRIFLLLIAIISAALVWLSFARPQLMISPGTLIPAHADLQNDCFACHLPWRGATSVNCTTCHKLPDIGLRTTKGTALTKSAMIAFHQQLLEQNCTSCHISHEGSTFSLRTQPGFSHSLLRAEVRDRCSGCHAAPKNNLHRNLGSNCGQCHQQQSWKPATFDHDKLFVLDRDHNVACTTCHTNNNYARFTCYGCHEHTVANIHAEHREEGISNFDNCVRCHRSADEENERGNARDGRERD